MTFNEGLTLVLTMLGTHAAIGALFGWLGGVAGARIARNEQARLDAQLQRLDSDLGTAAHVRRSQYDHEFGIYRELWKTVFDVGKYGSALAAQPNNVDYGKLLADELKALDLTISHNQPFYADDIANIAKKIQNILMRMVRTVSLKMALAHEFTTSDTESMVMMYRDIKPLSEELLKVIRLRMDVLGSVPFNRGVKPLSGADAMLFQPVGEKKAE